MRTNVLLESSSATKLMIRLLDQETRSFDIRFKACGPSSYIYSSARTLLGVVGEPVAVVLDAELTYPEAVMRRRQTAEEVIGSIARRAPFLLLVAVPFLESLLFARPDLIARAFGEGADDGGHVLDIGRLSPRDAYKRLDPNGSEEATFLKLFQSLDDEDVATLREESPIRELIAFLAEVGSPASSLPVA